jgi:A/G-specific adenine glycosylase
LSLFAIALIYVNGAGIVGAQKVVSELGGFLPTNAKDMEANVPGIGRYSAGAICSISYNECVPVVCATST